MFAKTIIDSDAFLDMPISARLLYYDLGMRAKDKGIITNLLSICKSNGCDIKNVNVLITNGFVKSISDGVYEITHWEENNGIGEVPKKRISYKYRKWREEVLVRDSYICQKCGVSEKVMNVHHIKPFSKYELLRYEMSNGITLCQKCHLAIHKEERNVGS
jgi:hypothetical protein